MTPDHVRRFHHERIRPSASTLIAVGDCDHESIRRFAERAFDGWTENGRRPAAVDASADGPSRVTARLTVVPRPGAAQSELRIGHVAAPRNTPDYHALLAANMVLGGQFTSRINLKLREEKGVTYGARTVFDFRQHPGPFVLQVSVQTSASAESIEDSLREIVDIRGARPITREELSLATAGLTRGYARNFETADQIARALLQLAMYDLPDSYFAEFVPRIERLTPEEITEAFVRHVDPARLAVVLVGDLEAIGHDLPRLNMGEPVVLAPETF
jgi:zinc protease